MVLKLLKGLGVPDEFTTDDIVQSLEEERDTLAKALLDALTQVESLEKECERLNKLLEKTTSRKEERDTLATSLSDSLVEKEAWEKRARDRDARIEYLEKERARLYDAFKAMQTILERAKAFGDTERARKRIESVLYRLWERAKSTNDETEFYVRKHG